MTGRLTNHTAFLELELLGANDPYELIVDTGFDGSLYLPEDLIAAWNLTFVLSTPVNYADGNIVTTDLYEATVVWFGTATRVTVLAGPTGCESLLGMGLLSGCRIELDEAAGEVRISKL